MAQISVILPTYNRMWSLARCIDSILSQSFSDFELIIVNDGSTDATLSYLQSLSDPRILVYTQDNQGVSAARNKGVGHSNTSLLAFIDSDDEWHKQKLELQLEFHTKNHFQIHQSQEIWIRNDVRVNAPKHLRKKSGDLFKECLLNCMITPSSVFMTKEVFLEFKGFDISFPACEDYDLWLKITAKYPIGLLEKDLLIRYGGHEDQLSAKYLAMDRFRLQSMLNFLQNHCNTEQHQEAVLKVMHKKKRILEKGAIKHSNTELIQWINSTLWPSPKTQ